MSTSSSVPWYARVVTMISIVSLLNACAVPSIATYANDVVTHHTTLQKMQLRACNNPGAKCQEWKEPDYYRENGHRVYREQRNSRCWYHWEVDDKDRIVAWRVESPSNSFWSRNYCDFLPEQGERFSPWFDTGSKKIESR